MPVAVTAPPAEAVAKLQAWKGKLCSEQSVASHIQSAHAEMLAARTAQMARTESEAAREAQGQTQLPTGILDIFSEHATGIGACLDAQKARDVAESSEMETATSRCLTHEAECRKVRCHSRQIRWGQRMDCQFAFCGLGRISTLSSWTSVSLRLRCKSTQHKHQARQHINDSDSPS